MRARVASFCFALDRVEPVIAQGAEQPFALRRPQPVDQVAKRRAQVEHGARQRPAERQVAGAFCVCDEADEQRAAIGPIRGLLAKFVAPELERPPGAQLASGKTDDVWALAGPRDELEVVQPDLLER